MKRNYFIFSNGQIKRKDNTFIFIKEDSEKKTIPVETVNDIYSFSEMNYNSKFFNFLSQQGIILHQFNYYGFYSGSFYPRDRLISGNLLVNQVKVYLNSSRRLRFAKKFIESGVFQIIWNLRYIQKTIPIEKEIQKIEELKNQIDRAESVNGVMVIEAQIRKLYYDLWNIFFDWDEPFMKRTKRPPQNSLNALISFGNSMMYTAVLSEIYRTQLNPTISYLHEPGVRRYSLSLDIAEIFKPLIVDKLIFKLINKKMLSITNFDRKLNFCYLDEKGRKIFVREWDKRLKTTIKHRQLHRHVSYKRLIRLELYKIIKDLLNEKEYKPFHVWW